MNDIARKLRELADAIDEAERRKQMPPIHRDPAYSPAYYVPIWMVPLCPPLPWTPIVTRSTNTQPEATR